MSLKNTVLVSLGLALVLVLAACGNDNNDNAAGEGKVEKVTYENSVKEIISKNCLVCHGTDAPTFSEFDADKEKYKGLMKGPKMVTYEDLILLVKGDEAGALMRRLDDGTSKDDKQPGNMYNNLGKTEEERQANLAVLKEWVGSWSLKRSAELTDDERAAITAVEK